MCGKGWSARPSASIASISFCLDFGTFHCPYPELGKASFRPCRPLAPELPGMGSLLVAGSWVACSQPCLGPSPVPTPPPREMRQQWGPEGCSPRPPDTCWAVGKQELSGLAQRKERWGSRDRDLRPHRGAAAGTGVTDLPRHLHVYAPSHILTFLGLRTQHRWYLWPQPSRRPHHPLTFHLLQRKDPPPAFLDPHLVLRPLPDL